MQSDAGVTIDLAAGTAEGGHAEGDTLTGIESVRASDHDDVLVARNDDPATTEDAEGSTLYGQRGDDSLSGGDGDDYLWGGKGDDTLMGGANVDDLEGGAARTCSTAVPVTTGRRISCPMRAVTVNLATGEAAGGHAEGDTLTGIEFLWGSSHVDSLTGDAGFNALEGGAGADMLDGGAGNDWAAYELSDAGVTVNLATGEAAGGHGRGRHAHRDRVPLGSSHADRLTGDAGFNVLEGRAGADMLDGGAGNDHASYFDSDAGVTVNLATGEAAGGHAEGDTLTGIEFLWGSSHADRLTGDDAGFNFLVGGAGADILDGGAGNDRLLGGAGADMLDGGEGWTIGPVTGTPMRA